MSLGVSTTSYSRMMCGCMKRRRILISRRTAMGSQLGRLSAGAAGGAEGASPCVARARLACQPAAAAAAAAWQGHAAHAKTAPWRCSARRHTPASSAPAAPGHPPTLLLHVHLLDLLAVQDLDGHLVPRQDVLRHLDLRAARRGAARGSERVGARGRAAGRSAAGASWAGRVQPAAASHAAAAPCRTSRCPASCPAGSFAGRTAAGEGGQRGGPGDRQLA